MVMEDFLTLGVWVHGMIMIYRSCVIVMYTSNLYGPINQCHPNKFNLKINCPYCEGLFLDYQFCSAGMCVSTLLLTPHCLDHCSLAVSFQTGMCVPCNCVLLF